MYSIKITDRFKRVLYILFIGSTLWIALILLAPVLNFLGYGFANYLYFLFKPVCHQIPERSLLIYSEPMTVCTRCFAIYSGSYIFVIIVLLQKKIKIINIKYIILFLLPTILDFILEKMDGYLDLTFVRIITGLLFGVAIMYLLVYSLIENRNKYLTKRNMNYGKSEIN